MPLDPKQRHRLLMADRTADPAWISAVIEHLIAADPTVALAEVEEAFRDAACASYLIACPGKSFQVVTGGMPAMQAAVAAVGLSPEQNRTALAAML
jgi:NADPH-dependent ferric siderophore reductase